VFENRTLKRIRGPKTEEVTGDWGILYNEELHNMCSSEHIITVIKSRRVKWRGHVARRGKTNAYEIVGKNEGKRSLRTPVFRWENNI
jgi:hypothetical protein